MAMRRCEMLVVFALAFFCGQPFAQNNADHAGRSDLPGSWKADCTPRGCLMHTDVLRGDSGSPGGWHGLSVFRSSFSHCSGVPRPSSAWAGEHIRRSG